MRKIADLRNLKSKNLIIFLRDQKNCYRETKFKHFEEIFSGDCTVYFLEKYYLKENFLQKLKVPTQFF